MNPYYLILLISIPLVIHYSVLLYYTVCTINTTVCYTTPLLCLLCCTCIYVMWLHYHRDFQNLIIKYKINTTVQHPRTAKHTTSYVE